MGKIEYELEDIQNEKGEILLERFNEIIDKVILEQPVIPFIYEKLGVKYRHYFIDEFQDTSKLQWSNLIPLVSHSLEGLDDKQRKRFINTCWRSQTSYLWLEEEIISNF